ncbi:MAG: hypothetical protein NW217_01980 [Hyphomicrobiaceae bacterium]|nr:hypothetical protein [Hyphomicrobiaceae bacterium]
MPITARKFLSRGAALSADEEARFFAAIKAANGTFKTTMANRMPEIDAALAEVLIDAGILTPVVLDAAVSSGVTTLDLREALIARHLHPSIVATDILVNARLIDLDRQTRALVDDRGHPLQFDIMGVAVSPWHGRLHTLLGLGLISGIMMRKLARHVPASGGPGDVVKLVTQRLTRAPSVEVIEDDLGIPNPRLFKRFDLVRAANVLNRAYFDDAAIARMARSLATYLKGEGGLLLVNRTHADGANHGTLFRLTGGRFVPRRRFGSGSEIEPIIDAITV